MLWSAHGGLLAALQVACVGRDGKPVEAFHDFPTHRRVRAGVDDLELQLREVGAEVEVFHVEAEARGGGAQLHVARRGVARGDGDVLRVALEAGFHALHGVVTGLEVGKLVASVAARDGGGARRAERDVHALDGFGGVGIGHKALDLSCGFLLLAGDEAHCKGADDAENQIEFFHLFKDLIFKDSKI